MQIKHQANEEMQSLAKMLKGERTALLTLPDELGSLSTRPMTVQELDEQGCCWMMVSRSAPWVAQAAGQSANLAFAMPGNGDYVSIAGRVELVDDLARKEALWTTVARPWWSGPTDPDLLLIQHIPARIEVWDGPDSAVSRSLALAASVVAGREIGMGDKQVIEPAPPRAFSAAAK